MGLVAEDNSLRGWQSLSECSLLCVLFSLLPGALPVFEREEHSEDHGHPTRTKGERNWVKETPFVSKNATTSM